MIPTIISICLSFIFITLGAIHFYWLLGGTWGISKVIPTKREGAEVVAIPRLATLIVAAILITFGLFYLHSTGIILLPLPSFMVQFSLWIIPVLFIVRAIGDFKYVGFFKKINDTNFAKADTKLFSPLCLGIGILGIILKLIY
ncbi:DUF3995 domain-containing protein [Flammeovirga sp. SubArs3]|uniref:DUF3995 domain-containing protein n=1 Tax=Flammeovirga sp. SubArs3 TaxID=2995316 RepID=UPI00248C5888|nr:DUF3995 domain-containing protein [Flammeovirga sp. SubArs3]